MATYIVYAVYDFRLDRFHDDMLFADDASARDEFVMRVNAITKNWAKREFERYFLYALGENRDGVYSSANKPRMVMTDCAVKLSYARFFEADPPADKAAEAEIEAEYSRLCALDVERLAAYDAAKPGNRDRNVA